MFPECSRAQIYFGSHDSCADQIEVLFQFLDLPLLAFNGVFQPVVKVDIIFSIFSSGVSGQVRLHCLAFHFLVLTQHFPY